MSWTNYDDVISQLVNAGLDIQGGIEVDTAWPVRCLEAGGDREKRGWYWLNTKEIGDESYITGACGIYRGNNSGKLSIKVNRDGKALKISAEEKAAIAARQKANLARMKALREAEADKAAHAAGIAWRKYVPDGVSEYLARKGVASHGLRFSPSGNGTLAVPMMDAGGKVYGLQLIRGKNRGKKLEKEFWPRGMAMQGHYYLIGGVPRELVLIAEGYATAATLFEAMGYPVVVAFTAGNLTPVAEAIRKAYRKAKILICADDDYLTEGNPGVTAAKNAAHAVDGMTCAPMFADERPTDYKGPTDYNDLQQIEGVGVVRAQVEAALRSIGWWGLAAPARVALSGGTGEAREEMPSTIQVIEAAERFSMVYGTGGTWFDDHEHMLVPKSDLMDILPEHGMRDLRQIKRVVRLDEVGFDPACTDTRIKCNLWGGWPTTPKAGCCDVLLELLQYLCGDAYKWVLFWLAYPIQHPGAKMRTALVLHGPQGAGKNLFFDTYLRIFGPYGRSVDQSAIEDKFNDWASRMLVLLADEVVARAELYHVKNKLKGFITGESIRINPKNVAAHDEKNHVNIIFLSNERQPLVIDQDDRRYAVIWTPEKLSERFYQDVGAELAAGGEAALHDYLLNLDLGDFNEHTKPPMTEAKRDLIDISMDSVERFVRDWSEGSLVFSEDQGALPFCACASGDLYAVYTKWCRREGVARPRESNQFAGHVTKLPGWQKCMKDRYETLQSTKSVRQRFIIPSPNALANAAKIGIQSYQMNGATNQTAWLTECFFAFRNAIGGLE